MFKFILQHTNATCIQDVSFLAKVGHHFWSLLFVIGFIDELLTFLNKNHNGKGCKKHHQNAYNSAHNGPSVRGCTHFWNNKQKYIRGIKNILCLAYCHSNQNVITVTSDTKNRHCVVFIRTYLALQELDITHTTRFHYCTVLPHVLFNILTELTITISVHVPQFWWINKSSPQILSDVKLPGVFSTYPGSHLEIRKTHLVKLNNSKNKFTSFLCIYCTESFHIRCPFLADVGWITDAKGSTFTSFTHSITNWSTCKNTEKLRDSSLLIIY